MTSVSCWLVCMLLHRAADQISGCACVPASTPHESTHSNSTLQGSRDPLSRLARHPLFIRDCQVQMVFVLSDHYGRFTCLSKPAVSSTCPLPGW
jgi:hypothetical protein